MDNGTVFGLLGPASSGKDLVGDWLIGKGCIKISLADPMKRFVQKAFNISTNALWGDSKFRNEEFEVDTDWWYAAIGALPTAAEEVINHVLLPEDKSRGYVALMEWFTHLRTGYVNRVSARVVLQTLGTEWGRTVDPMMWTRYCHKTIDKLKLGGSYTQYDGFSDKTNGKLVSAFVIPDHRFKNEVEYTQFRKGYIIRLRRLSREAAQVGVANHQSETEQKSLPDEAFDLVINLPEFSKNGALDLVGLHKALEPVYQEELWKYKLVVELQNHL
jgi:hypothetical protein